MEEMLKNSDFFIAFIVLVLNMFFTWFRKKATGIYDHLMGKKSLHQKIDEANEDIKRIKKKLKVSDE